MARRIYDNTLKILQQLSAINIKSDTGKTTTILSALKQLPRTGKAVRIDKYKLKLRKQSVYDHIMELAYIADAIIDIYKIKADRKLLAEMCAFHDLAEILIGDAPFFTPKKMAGKNYLSQTEKAIRENKANDLLLNLLPRPMAISFQRAIKNKDSLFWMIDKIEPIVSVWRYIYFCRDKIVIQKYLLAMTDFFTNPSVKKYAINKNFKKIIEFLQNKSNNKKYYTKGNVVLKSFPDVKSANFLKLVIEKNKLKYIT